IRRRLSRVLVKPVTSVPGPNVSASEVEGLRGYWPYSQWPNVADAGIEADMRALFLNPFPQEPASSTTGAFDVQPSFFVLYDFYDLEVEPRIHYVTFLSIRIRCTQEISGIILRLDLHNV